MNEDLFRTMAVLSAGVSAGGLLIAVRSCRRPARIRMTIELGMLVISFAALPIISATTGVHTPPAFAVLAIAAGMAAGMFQGSHLEVEHQGAALMARRSVPALGAWGAGILVVQGAGAASRAGVLEAGQALSYFGAAMSFGLLVGRQGVLNRVAMAGCVALATGSAAWLAIGGSTAPVAAQAPPPAPTATPTPRIFKPTGTVDTGPLIGQLGALVSPSMVKSNVSLEFSEAGGPVKGTARLVIEDFQIGILVAIMQGLGEAIGGAIGGAIAGGSSLGTAGGDDSIEALQAKLPPELKNCRGNFTSTFTMEGSYDPAAKTLTGTYVAQSALSDFRGCPPSANALQTALPPEPAQRWTATFDGKTVSGSLVSSQKDAPPAAFKAALAEEPKAAAPPAASGSPGAGTEKPGDGEGEEGEKLLPPPVEIKDLTPREGAGAAIIGLGAAVMVSVAATAQTAGTAPTAEPRPKRRPEEAPPEPLRQPTGPQPVTEENIGWTIQHVAQMAQDAGYGDIVRAIDQGLLRNDLTPQDMERLRDMLKRRKELDEYLASTPLYTESDASAFVRGCQEDAAWLAEKMGRPEVAWVLRNPAMAARIGAAIATEGSSEVFMTAWDVGEAVAKAANTPGDASTSAVVTDVAAAAAIETAWQVVPGMAMEKAIGKVMGEAVEQEAKAIARGGQEGLEATGRDAAREATESAVRTTSDAESTVVRQADEAAGAAAHASDDAARAAPGQGATPEPQGAKPPGPDDAPRAPGEPSQPGATGAGDAAPPPLERVDDTWLKEAEHGTSIPRDRITQTGYTEKQADALRQVADEEGVLIGSRTTNVDSLRHPDALPKPEPVKGKTIKDVDVQLGAREGDQGLAAMFEPRHPGPNAPKELLERYGERAAEFEKLKKQLPELEQKGVHWNKETGLFTNADGVPYRGDIDIVYIRDAKNPAEIVTGERYDRVMAKLRASGVEAQHGAETGILRDMAREGRDLDAVMGQQAKLSAAHEAGRETVIETSAAGWQKGPSPRGGMHEQLTGQPWLRQGLPVELPDE